MAKGYRKAAKGKAAKGKTKRKTAKGKAATVSPCAGKQAKVDRLTLVVERLEAKLAIAADLPPSQIAALERALKAAQDKLRVARRELAACLQQHP